MTSSVGRMWSRLAAMRFKDFQFFWPDSPLAGLCLSAGSPRVFVWLVWLGPCAFALPCGLVAGRLGGLLNVIPEGNCGSSYFSAPRDNFKTRVAGAMHAIIPGSRDLAGELVSGRPTPPRPPSPSIYQKLDATGTATNHAPMPSPAAVYSSF